jgi:hypothetical protein
MEKKQYATLGTLSLVLYKIHLLAAGAAKVRCVTQLGRVVTHCAEKNARQSVRQE